MPHSRFLGVVGVCMQCSILWVLGYALSSLVHPLETLVHVHCQLPHLSSSTPSRVAKSTFTNGYTPSLQEQTRMTRCLGTPKPITTMSDL
ncbi:hypothetical protein B0T21DRAFT_363418 [Apiosordaria backusii]|uniref:Uncharacterized protein n=1 Tax=Apiosordaria backusii TaxID=314023 RepID=A0AA40EFL9_9PEZI|nr:hypothetical protein B0T21DRAFT_363418 [Apiosordaria backusii]